MVRLAQAQEFILHIAETEARSRGEDMLISMTYKKMEVDCKLDNRQRISTVLNINIGHLLFTNFGLIKYIYLPLYLPILQKNKEKEIKMKSQLYILYHQVCLS